MRGGRLAIAYLHFGAQSGVTSQVEKALAGRGHLIVPRMVPGPLEPRDPRTGRPRPSVGLAMSLLASARRFGLRGALAHRWNTPFAFDAHSRRAGELLRGLEAPADIVLQNGGLFAPGLPPAHPYALLLDHTRALSMRRPAWPEDGVGAPLDYGMDWREREHALYHGARAVCTFSRRVAESLQNDYRVPGERIHVVGAGANVMPEQVERRDDGRTLLFVGTRFDIKGGRTLLRAFARLRRERPGVRLVVAGPKGLALPERATSTGFVPPERLPALFAQATVFVLPTLTDCFGLAYLDAMACGVPCVGTAVEAVPEIIDHGETGLLVPPGDDVALAAALGRLLDDPERAREMGRRGREKVERAWRWEHVAQRLEQALRDAPLIHAVPPAPGERAASPRESVA